MLQLIDIQKTYKTASLEQHALKDVTLSLRDSEFVAVLGPSGSGKTTLLNIIGGLDRYDGGELVINGISTKRYGPRDWDSYRNHSVGFVFQNYNLIPHQSLLSNVELALTISGVSREERKRRAKEALEKVGLTEHMYKRPGEISGGQMQRVAIARALVNDPDILLADEPTGALDTDTSLQVMDLLKEVASDRLVVMVTHNAELAEQYATRIVKLRDGRIEADSDPFLPDPAGSAPAVHRSMGRSSMSFGTALALSFNNLRTKKARTILVALAGSIGIIGIALIMALSNGVNRYVADIESEALQNYPLTLTDTSFSPAMFFTMAGDAEDGEEGSGTASGDVKEFPMLSNFFSQMVSNDLGSLKRYFESGQSEIYDNVQAIEYGYNIVPQIFSDANGSVRQVNPDTSFAALGFSSGGSSNSLWNAFSSSDTFAALPADPDLYIDHYEVKAGRWPENHNECVVVLSRSGMIADMCLYAMGLKDPADLDSMVQAFADGREVEVSDAGASYRYEDFLDRSFKVIPASSLYTYDEGYGVWVDHSGDLKYVGSLMETAEDLTVVGVVQPSEETAASFINMGVAYPASLTDHLIGQAAESGLVKAQLADPETNVLTGLAFGAEKDSGDMDLSSLFSVDGNALANAFSFDPGRLDLDLSDLDLSGIDLSGLDLDLDLSVLDPGVTDPADLVPQLSEEQIRELLSGVDLTMTGDAMQERMNGIWNSFMEYARQTPEFDYGNIGGMLRDFLQTGEGRQELQGIVDGFLRSSNLQNVLDSVYGDMEESVREQLAERMQPVIEQLAEQVRTRVEALIRQTVQGMMDTVLQRLRSGLSGAFRFDQDAFADAFRSAMDMDELSDLMMSMYYTEDTTCEANLRRFGYADKDRPGTITIYPTDFEAKGRVKDIIEDYNAMRKKAGEDDKVIAYTDTVDILMGSVTDIINVIRDVLIAFVSISLVVSSVMIGVITYISVLERKKEIGVLRAIGASKRNIAQVFNAETFLTGALAGLLGIGITLAALPFINTAIHRITGEYSVNAVLPLKAAGLLVILSIILTLIGGIIPSQKAAKSDPVAALRSE